METGLRQKGGGLLAGSSIVASPGRGCVGFMAKRSWVGEQEKHMEGLEQRQRNAWTWGPLSIYQFAGSMY